MRKGDVWRPPATLYTTMTTLLPHVFLYIPNRKNNTGFILMNTSKEDNVWKMTQADPPPMNSPPAYSIVKPDTPTKGEFLCTIVIKNKENILLNKRLRYHEDIVITTMATGASIPVVSMAQHTTVFGSHTLKCNVVFDMNTPTPALSNNAIGPSLSNLYTIVYTAPVTPAPPFTESAATTGNVIQHTVAVIKKYKSSSAKDKDKSLNPFVAKQLLDLAIIRKEFCAITAEELSAENAAVMPCGHIFMRFAIEESFKKESNKCPWCRQHGTPTYV